MSDIPETKIVRAGFKTNAFTAGTAEVSIAGSFSTQDAEDIVSLLEMVLRMVRRQAGLPEKTS